MLRSHSPSSHPANPNIHLLYNSLGSPSGHGENGLVQWSSIKNSFPPQPELSIYGIILCHLGLSRWRTRLPASAEAIRDTGLIPGSGRSPGAGNGNPLQYSCLENPMDRGGWRAAVHAVAKSQTQLSG